MNYKKRGINAFKNRNFDLAILFFSLSYKIKQDEEDLFLLNLSFTAKYNQDECMLLFDFYKLRHKDKSDLFEFVDILDSIDSDLMPTKPTIIDDKNAISYKDFKFLVSKNSDFKSTFERVMFSTRVFITSKDDLLNFINDLIDNGFLELSFNYLETAASIYLGDQEISEILKKIKYHENTNQR